MVGSTFYVSLFNGFRVIWGDININMTSTNIVSNDKAYTRTHKSTSYSKMGTRVTAADMIMATGTLRMREAL